MARYTRRCAASWRVTTRTCTCSRSYCRWPRPGASHLPSVMPWWPRWSRPDSRGCVRQASVDPQAAPLIDPGYLREGRDVDRLAEGLEMVRQAGARTALSRFRLAEVWPGANVRTSAGLRGYIRRRVGSYYHPAGTCRMGPGPDAVVDPHLRVHGVTGLRVADASV